MIVAISQLPVITGAMKGLSDFHVWRDGMFPQEYADINPDRQNSAAMLILAAYQRSTTPVVL
jgi:hypothetical protein